MKERPILFSGPMVRTILEGRKTQTRRVVKPQPVVEFYKSNGEKQERVTEEIYRNVPGWGNDRFHIFRKTPEARGASPKLWAELNCPYGKIGDRLWVRETFREPGSAQLMDNRLCRELAEGEIIYGSDDVTDPGPWRPSIHMPRWASRITLEIVSVRVERLQDISEEGSKAEGVDWTKCPSFQTTESMIAQIQANKMGMAAPHIRKIDYIGGFRLLWDSINFKRGYPWSSNPWVWVIEFKRVLP